VRVFDCDDVWMCVRTQGGDSAISPIVGQRSAIVRFRQRWPGCRASHSGGGRFAPFFTYCRQTGNWMGLRLIADHSQTGTHLGPRVHVRASRPQSRPRSQTSGSTTSPTSDKPFVWRREIPPNYPHHYAMAKGKTRNPSDLNSYILTPITQIVEDKNSAAIGIKPIPH